LGWCFKTTVFYPWLTVQANVDLAFDNSSLSVAERRDRTSHYLRLVGLADYAKAYPRQLSGGMAQRAAIARALAQEPEVLLMDEPFGALDSILRMRLQDELLSIWEKNKVSIVIVTHDVEEALYLADRVLVMEPNPGRIRDVVEVGLPRPRDRGDPGLADLKRRCLATLV
jgi:sulfonate transport system ATP-binding protein